MSMAIEKTIKDSLFTNAMKSNWQKVIEEYSRDSRAHKMVITQSKDTALHLAVRANQEEVVAELILRICSFKTEKEVLGKMNERKNTPLHIAASLGSVKMCKDIASIDPFLVDDRNNDGETPLFLAALHGYKQAFLCLHSFCSSDLRRLHTNCRRNGGDSVLHSAIRNEYFDLALQIIRLNPEMPNWYNDQGFTALHLLASKPTAFRSGSTIGPWKTIIYQCTIVDKLKADTAPCCHTALKKISKPKQDYYPPNYKTCMYFFELLWQGILVVSNLKKDMKNDEAKKDADSEKGEAKEGSDFEMDKTEERMDINLLERNNLKTKLYPENYATCIHFFKVLSKAILIILGFGSVAIKKIRQKKQKHTWCVQVMDAILEKVALYKYGDDGTLPPEEGRAESSDDQTETKPYRMDAEKRVISFDKTNLVDVGEKKKQGDKETQSSQETDEKKESGRRRNELKETPILIAAKNGVVEMVEKILEQFPVAIYDMNKDKKNAVLLAAENRQPEVYNLLLGRKLFKESMFQAVDSKGNNALHLAANLGAHKPWLIPGAALQMQWEVKWYKYVRSSMPPHSSARYNDKDKIPKMIFGETHKELVKSGGEWLSSTAQNCSVVAALVVTVAFAAATTIPGGPHQEKGTPLLQKHPAFMVFTLSSFIALISSVVSVLTFLAISTSRFEEKDFKSNLPMKLLVGFFTLLFSILAMLVSFCASHFFLLKSHHQQIAFEVYTIVCVLVLLFFVMGQFPLYFDLLQSYIRKVPKRSSKVPLN